MLRSPRESMNFEASGVPCDDIRDEFLKVRSNLMQSIMTSFSPSAAGPSRLKLPTVDPREISGTEKACEPYLRFYAGHQRQIDFNIQKLRAEVRQVASGLSPALAQLAALDKTLGSTLSPHARKSFAAIPGLSGTPRTLTFASLRLQATPATTTCSIVSSSSTTQVPSLSLNEERTWMGTLYFLANSTERVWSTLAPTLA